MTAAGSPTRRFSPGAAAALSVLVAVAGLIVPPLPLIRLGAWSLALATGAMWLGALYIFFVHFAGPGLLLHLGLWFLALIGLAMPRHVASLEARVRRQGGR